MDCAEQRLDAGKKGKAEDDFPAMRREGKVGV